MRIISDEHDYYDVIQSHGQDQSIVYIRKLKTIYLADEAYPFPTMGRRGNTSIRSLDSSVFVIGFCGKIYPLIILSTRFAYGNKTFYCYNIGEFDKVISTYLNRRALKKFKDSKYGNRLHYIAFFEKCQQKQDDFTDWFIDRKCPVFVATKFDNTVHLNSCLREYQFYKVFDTWSAFQAIYSYMANFAIPIKDIPTIDDKIMVEIKGFDKKWSFRKKPTKKK